MKISLTHRKGNIMKAALHNLGCKVNAYETDVMQEMLEQEGYEIVSFQELADVYLVNTCSVTNIADRKSRQMLRQAKRRNPDAIIVAAGCYVQTKEHADVIDESIDIVIGNNKKQDLLPILREFQANREGDSYHLIDINQTSVFEGLTKKKPGVHTRSVIKIQDGCNQFCSYCIIPMLRGRVRSRAIEQVIEEVKQLAEHGCQEVILTGIHLSSYGIDFKDTVENPLLVLIHELNLIDGIKRIRLGSLEPRIITEDFVQGLRKEAKFCPHFHLSLQSGNNETLKRMNRHYSSEDYAKRCVLIRKYFIQPAITTDIIVGFPGETEEEFQTTKTFVDSIDFYETHVFKFSKREGTKAATMDGQVASEVMNRRSNELITLSERKKAEFEAHLLGTEVEILVEGQLVDGRWYGHTPEYVKVAVNADKNIENTFQTVKISDKSQIIH